jgi:uncharacterized membrane protein HdeD (DUF308 family)
MSEQTVAQPTGTYPPAGRNNGIGVAALVFGVVSLVLALLVIYFPIAGLAGLIAAVLGVIGMGRANRGEADNRGQALAGLITGLLGLAIAIVLTVQIGAFFSQHQQDFRKLGSCLTGADTNDQRAECVTTFSDAIDDNS